MLFQVGREVHSGLGPSPRFALGPSSSEPFFSWDVSPQDFGLPGSSADHIH